MSKKSPRHLSRSLAVQALYSYKINQSSVVELEKLLNDFERDLYEHANYELMHSLIENSINKFDEMLEHYKPYLQREIGDINLIEKIILVIAAVELINNLLTKTKTYKATTGNNDSCSPVESWYYSIRNLP